MHCLLPDLTWLLCATKFPQITLSHLQSSAKNQCLKALLLKKPELFVGKEVEISSLSKGRFFSGFYSCCMTRSLSSTALTAPGGEAANPHSRAHVKNQPAPAMAATPSSPESRESTYWGRKEGTLFIKAADINLPFFWSLPQPAVMLFVLSKWRFHAWNSSTLQKYPDTEWKALGESPKIQAKEFRDAF